MKLRLVLPRWQTIELEGSPQECASFLGALSQNLPGSEPPVSEKEESARSSLNIQKADIPTFGKKEVAPTSPQNRRQMVLDVLGELANRGQQQPSLKTILDCCEKLYPSAEMKNLDQVVRDLANKTDLVESPQRGRYQLKPKN